MAQLAPPQPLFRTLNPLPGFGLTMGTTVIYLSLIVLLPLLSLAVHATALGWTGFWELVTTARVRAALQVTFGISIAAAAIDVCFGLIVAWVLVRYRFAGRRLLDAAVDLPFALPTAVAGLSLAALYAPNGWIGALLAPLGVKIAFTPLGIGVALVFVGLPFVVRTLQPVLGEIDREVEEASATLGARRFQTLARVILPPLIPTLLTGFALALARATGEYGSVIFIAGNIPFVSEIAPVLITQEVEAHNYPGATAIAVVMLMISFFLIFAINLLQAASRRKYGDV